MFSLKPIFNSQQNDKYIITQCCIFKNNGLYMWELEYKHGHTSTKDDACSECPKSATSPNTASRLHKVFSRQVLELKYDTHAKVRCL